MAGKKFSPYLKESLAMKKLLLFAVLLVLESSPQNFWQSTSLAATGTINAIVVNPLNGYIYAATEFAATGSGVLVSTNDGLSWCSCNTGITSPSVKTIAVNSQGVLFAAGTGIFRSYDNGNSWYECTTGLTTPYITSLMIDRNDRLIAGTDGEGLYTSTDDGTLWTFFGLTSYSPIVLECDSSGYLYAGAGVIYRSSNDGQNWTIAMNGMGGSTIYDFMCDCMGNIYAATMGDGVYKSSDHGDNWIQINNGLGSTNVLKLAKNTAEHHIYAGTYDGGIYRTTDGGANWTDISSGLNTTGFKAIAVSTSGYAFAGSFSGRIFKSTSPVVNVNEPLPLPRTFLVCQNYPNPFNPVTIIEYTLATSSQVVLSVYSPDGNRVSVIDEGLQPAGYHRILFDGGKLASGVYCYTLQAGNERVVKKMVIVR